MADKYWYLRIHCYLNHHNVDNKLDLLLEYFNCYHHNVADKYWYFWRSRSFNDHLMDHKLDNLLEYGSVHHHNLGYQYRDFLGGL